MSRAKTTPFSGDETNANATEGDSADFSPDGTRIVYSHSTERDLYVINIDGTGKTKLTSTPDTREYRPRWSPDGMKIVCFAETTGAAAQILVMNADGSGSTPVRSENNIQNADWSPSGAKILFENWNSGEIFTMNADGGGAVNLTNNVGKDTNPSW